MGVIPPDLVAVESPRNTNKHKVTARMLKIRELIEQGEYPDRDLLAERIVAVGR